MKVMTTIIDPNEKNRRKKEKRKIDRRNEDGLTLRQQQKEEFIPGIVTVIHTFGRDLK